MIISASRRTDIPAFYFEWFLKRLEEGYFIVKNPYNPRLGRRVIITPEAVDCIVFWTKNPGKILKSLKKLDQLGYHCYYFLFTLNPYGREVEPMVPDYLESIEVFKRLVDIVGPKRVILRYDPIVVSKDYTVKYHIEKFGFICDRLKNHTERVIISFLKLYRKVKMKMRGIVEEEPAVEVKKLIIEKLKRIADSFAMRFQTCAVKFGEDKINNIAGKCIDNELITELSGKPVGYLKDRGQRKECLCTESVDIGTYNTCRHGCIYCYATGKSKAYTGHSELSLPFVLHE